MFILNLIFYLTQIIHFLGLCSRASSVRVVCEVWVEHALIRGDAGRLLETLLLALLGKIKLYWIKWAS